VPLHLTIPGPLLPMVDGLVLQIMVPPGLQFPVVVRLHQVDLVQIMVPRLALAVQVLSMAAEVQVELAIRLRVLSARAQFLRAFLPQVQATLLLLL